MSLGLFDVVGPIMHGPSSNHTAGANRIGYLARQIMGGAPRQLTFGFHPIFMGMFPGHRTHIAMLAGCLGLREYDEACNLSKQLADKEGITLACRPIEGEEVDRNTMRITGRVDGVDWLLNGISVGGGNIVFDQVNGVKTDIDGNCYLTLLLFRPGTDCAVLQEAIRAGRKDLFHLYFGSDKKEVLLIAETRDAVSQDELAGWIDLGGRENLILSRRVEPLYPFADKGDAPQLFTTFEEWMDLCKGRPLIDTVYAYEEQRSHRTRQEILEEALRSVRVIQKSMVQGIQGNNQLIGGLCTGSDGKAMADYAKSGRTLLGETFSMAIARALSMAEISASAGLLVAVPTSGSAGTLPGVLFTVAQQLHKDETALAESFLVAAAVGMVVGNTCSFSGSIGGCQAEIGIGAGMAAGGAVWLAGGSPEAVAHGAALAIKNTLGLICDPPARPVEVPCIKRNAMGVSVAMMAAEMSLAGIRSVMPPDDVVAALKDTQERLPTELRGACVGGLAAAPYAKVLQAKWQKKLDSLREL